MNTRDFLGEVKLLLTEDEAETLIDAVKPRLTTSYKGLEPWEDVDTATRASLKLRVALDAAREVKREKRVPCRYCEIPVVYIRGDWVHDNGHHYDRGCRAALQDVDEKAWLAWDKGRTTYAAPRKDHIFKEKS